MATLTQGKKATVLDQDGNQLTTANSTVFSSDDTKVGIDFGSGSVFAVGAGVGTSTLTATRLSDSATATLEVEVVAAAPFSISLGAEVDI